MAKGIHGVAGITVEKNGMRLELGTERLNRNLNNAQFALDSAIMTSMIPRMPFGKGSFISRVQAKNASLAGTGEVYAAVGPEGRFLYEGKVMVGERTRSAWAQKGERKVVTEKNLTYSNGRESHWFEKTKEADENEWKRIVEEEMKK